MNKIKYTYLVFLSLIITTNLWSQNKKTELQKTLKVFPKAQKGYNFTYIALPKMENENNYKIEFFVGMEKVLDCNSYFLVGDIKDENLTGFQYPYYVVESKGEIMGTLMGCLNQPETKKYVTLPSKLVRYNSQLPIVVYIPNNMKLKYRIWKAEETYKEGNLYK